MKHVFGSHAELAHVWANDWQRVEHGRCSDGRMFFDGPTLYSYGRHFAIARHIVAPDGDAAILFTSAGHSVSTGKHKTLTRQAIAPGVRVVLVNDPVSNDWRANFDNAVALADTHSKAALRRRKEYMREHDLRQAHAAFDRARLFATWGGFEAPATLDTARAELDLRLAAARKAAAMESAERAALIAVREEAKAALWDTVKPYWREASDVPDYVQAQMRAIGWYGVRDTYGLSVAMRVEGPDIVTSQGARFPIEHGVKAFRLLKGLWAAGADWQRNGRTIHLGHYQIDKVTSEGVTAGCHFVPRDEVELMARTLAVADVEAIAA